MKILKPIVFNTSMLLISTLSMHPIAAGYFSDTLLHLNDIFEDYILRFTTGYMFLLVSSKLNQFSNYVPLHAILAICCINPCIPTLESN